MVDLSMTQTRNLVSNRGSTTNKGNSSYRIAEMKGNPCYPEECTRFEIYEGGIMDISH
jgi:hypothetical protein